MLLGKNLLFSELFLYLEHRRAAAAAAEGDWENPQKVIPILSEKLNGRTAVISRENIDEPTKKSDNMNNVPIETKDRRETMKRAYLVLEDGQVFEGFRFGASGEAVGELVFTTGMCGYIETLTDPSYAGQIVMQTYPLIGNYGMMEEDFEGKCAVRGYVVREWCDGPSNFRTQYDLDTFLKRQGVPGICGVDTRQLTRIIRERGVMNAAICDAVPADLSAVKAYLVKDAVKSVTCSALSVHPTAGEERFRVSLIDYGAKRNIIRELQKRGCTVTVLPASVTAAEVLEASPDGVMLSNGPGDPAENTYQIEQIRNLLGKVPMFGICLGHQLTALAVGGSTYKLKYGHRGVNQPVRDLNGVRTYITSQNHGYAVDSDTVKVGKISFANANDGTCEGIDYPDLRAFTVQFHPEACTGPKDTSFLFDRFVDLMKGGEW
jgi:carbamoyl-phosphate synthase small subunit